MHQNLVPRLHLLRKQMRIAVTEKQAHLKEQKTGRPDRRTPTVPRQNVPRNHRLDLKQQKCTQKYGDRTKKGKQNMIRWEDK